MERYRETRDNTLIEEFKNRFKRILIVKGLWEYEEKEENLITDLITDFHSETVNNNNTYSRLNPFAIVLKDIKVGIN